MDYQNQHYLPPAYLQFFSLDPGKKRKSRIWIYDGLTHTEVPVESLGATKDCYTATNRQAVEGWFDRNLEGPYAAVIRKICRGQGCSSADAMTVFRFGIMLKFRSPAYTIPSGTERIDALDDIVATGLRGAFAGVPNPEDFTSASHFDRTVLKEMKAKIILTPDALAITDNPILIFQERNGKRWEAVIVPITYERIMVFYRPDRLSCANTISSADLSRYFMAMRDCRFGRFIFLPVKWDDIPMGRRIPDPIPTQEVTDLAVHHHFLHLNPDGFPPLAYLPRGDSGLPTFPRELR